MLSFAARRPASLCLIRRLTTEQVGKLARPIRQQVSKDQRAALRADRKERAARVLNQQNAGGATVSSSSSSSVTSSSGSGLSNSLAWSRWVWYLGVAVPTGLIVWAFRDENSPPAKLSRLIGLTGLITSFTDEISKPSFDKLLPDWSQIPNVPHDIPVPPTLVLDLENTLVSSTWDRKYGWRHAKRPGVDKFLHELAQYYEIVLYSPSIDGIADPVVTSLDRDGCILHRLYRDATYYHNGVHVKDLRRLNRNVKRIVVVDDDPMEVQFNPENLIRVKPYTDPTDRTDNTLLRILPFLVEIAREGYSDFPQLLDQYRGMDADEIADEQERRLQELRTNRENRARQGLGLLARGARQSLPAPELPPEMEISAYAATTQQLTAKDIAGAAPPLPGSDAGFAGWLNRRAKEKEEHQMRKMEKWNEVMMKQHREKREEAERQTAA